jgi:hypothetical protein
MRMLGSRLTLLAVSAVLACTRVPAVVAPQGEVETPVASPAVVVEAPSVAPTCIAKTPPGALLLIPDTTEWMFHIGPRALLRSSAYALFAPKIEQSSEWARIVETFRPCGVAVEHIDHLLVGFDAAENFVAILLAPGVGRPEVMRCMILAAQLGSSEQSLMDIQPLPGDASVSVIDLPDGRAYIFGDDMVALTTSAWQDAVTDLSSCRGTPAAYGSHAAPLRGLDLAAPLWLTGVPQTSTLAPLGNTVGIDLEKVSSVSASVRLDDGAVLQARAQMRDAASASSTMQTLRSLVPLLGSSMPPELAGLANRIVVDSNDAEVQLEATLRLEELRFLAGQTP